MKAVTNASIDKCIRCFDCLFNLNVPGFLTHSPLPWVKRLPKKNFFRW